MLFDTVNLSRCSTFNNH